MIDRRQPTRMCIRFLLILRCPPGSTSKGSSASSAVYKRPLIQKAPLTNSESPSITIIWFVCNAAKLKNLWTWKSKDGNKKLPPDSATRLITTRSVFMAFVRNAKKKTLPNRQRFPVFSSNALAFVGSGVFYKFPSISSSLFSDIGPG